MLKQGEETAVKDGSTRTLDVLQLKARVPAVDLIASIFKVGFMCNATLSLLASYDRLIMCVVWGGQTLELKASQGNFREYCPMKIYLLSQFLSDVRFCTA